jgi:hypothetical protein
MILFTFAKMLNDKLMNIIPQYMKSFALNIYYGVRQWLLQYMLFLMGCEIVQLFGESVYFGRFGLEGIIIVLCMFLYTMLYYWFKTFTPRLRPLLQIIIPYIPYALMIYLEIVMENDWNFKKVTFDYYMQLGMFMPLYSIAIIGSEYGLKAWLPSKFKRIANIVWNVLTILLIAFFVVLIILKMC